MRPTLVGLLSLFVSVSAMAQSGIDHIASIPTPVRSQVIGKGVNCAGAAVIYDTTHASNQGAEVAPTANGAACSLADKIVLGGTNRFICQIQIELFVLASTTPFAATMSLFTDCTSSGAANSPCGNGTGTLIPGSTVTVTGITPPVALGTIFTVSFPYGNLDLSGEADNTISVRLNPSRNDVFWRINETPTVGAIPAGEPATSFVERCGSTGTNNGCSRNFGVNNNFAINILAEATSPVELIDVTVE
jgi:hypothetical protein